MVTKTTTSCSTCGEAYYAKGFCRKHYEKDLLARNPEYHERQKKNARKWSRENRDYANVQRRKWALENPEKTKANRKRSKLRKYGLTPEQFDKMLQEQNGVCAVCERDNNGRTLHVDHCHDTGKVRGLLCFVCNYGIGYLGDRLETFEKIVEYLKN